MVKTLTDILGKSRVPELLQRILYRQQGAILMYHAVIDQPLPVPDWCFLDAGRFRRQMIYLRQNLDVVPLSELLSPKSRNKPAVAVTFDDGYRNNYTVAYPILKELALPATIFLATDLIGTDDTVWHCRINDALAHTRQGTLRFGERDYDLSTTGKKWSAGKKIQQRLKKHPHQQLLAKLRELIASLGEDPDKRIPPGSPYRMLAPAEIREMAASGLIDFGAHTSSHAILSLLPVDERLGEIRQSLQAVTALTGKPCRQFSYPNGDAGDFDLFDIAVLSDAGVRMAVTTISGPTTAEADCYNLRRYGVGADTSFPTFRMQVHHMNYFARRFAGR